MVNKKPQSVSNLQETHMLLNVPPWPEWDDAVVNGIAWGLPVPSASAKRTPAGSKHGASDKKGETPQQATSAIKQPFQESPTHGVLPDRIPVDKWMRPSEVEPDSTFALDPEPTPLDLISNNRHLFQFKVMRWMISSVMCLERCGTASPFPVEYTSSSFIPNTDAHWKPWHHVYGVTKAGHGHEHKPLYNPHGMYIIRLFYMGKWRRILVDDYFPYDKFGRLLLPSSQSTKNIWLPLLCKGLLRIASLSWGIMDDIKDFSVITCLTGWIQYTADFNGIDLDEAWDICCSHLMPKSELDEEPPHQIHCSQKFDGSCINDTLPHYCDSSNSRFIFAILPELKNWNDLPGVAPNLEHVIFIEKLIRDKITMDLPAWKEYRWLDWAYRNNVIPAKPGTVFKKLSAYCPFSKTINPLLLTDISDTMLSYVEEKKVDEDIEVYDFDILIKKIERIELYFLPSFFQNNVSTENIPSLLDHSLKGKVDIHSKHKFGDSRSAVKVKSVSNESFYLFTDSPFCKKFFVTLNVLNERHTSPQGYLMCEYYQWKSDTQGPTITSLRTFGSTTKIISFGPGKHICRIWYNIPQRYYLQVNSQSPFHIGNKELIQQVSQEESCSYNLFGDEMSRLFNELLSKEHGTKEQGMALMEYLSSFYPYHLRLKSMLYEQLKYSIPFDSIFEESLMELIFSKGFSTDKTASIIFQLRQLFLNPKLGEEMISQFKPELLDNLNNYANAQLVPDEASKVNSKSEKVHSEKKKKGTSTPLKSVPSKVKDSSMKPYSDLLLNSPENNIALLRKIVSKEATFLESYPFRFDDEMKLYFFDHKGVSTIISNHHFTVIGRIVVNVHSRKPVPCGIHLFMSGENGTPSVSLFNMDNYEIIPINYNANCTYYLRNIMFGYVIIILFFHGDTRGKQKQELHWRLRLLGYNHENIPHMCSFSMDENCPAKMIHCPSLARQTINGYYIPSTQNIVTKFIIKTSFTEIVTLQLTLSHPTACVRIIIYDQDEQVMIEKKGLGKLLVPAIILTPKEPRPGEVLPFFYGDITLLNEDSWLLTEEEQRAINLIWETYNPYANIPELTVTQSSASVSSKKTVQSRMSERSISSDKPTFFLTMYHSKSQTPGSSDITITHDNRNYIKMKSMLLEKEKSDPGRAKRGKALRETYLAEIEVALSKQEKQIEEETTSEELSQDTKSYSVLSSTSVEPVLFSQLLEKYSLPVDNEKLLLLKYLPYKELLQRSQLTISTYTTTGESVLGEPTKTLYESPVVSIASIVNQKVSSSRAIVKKIKSIFAEGNKLKEEVLFMRDWYITEAIKRIEELKKKEEMATERMLATAKEKKPSSKKDHHRPLTPKEPKAQTANEKKIKKKKK